MEINTMNSLFFTNVHLLGLDTLDMEGIYKIPFRKDMFNLPNKAGSEAILHFLFSRLNPTLSKEQFRDCWPIVDKSAEIQFRKVCNNWLTQIQEEPDVQMPRVNASLFLTPGGRKFVHFLYCFSTYVLNQVMKTEHDWRNEVIYPNTTSSTLLKCSMTAVQHFGSKECEEFFSNLHLLVAANRNWKHYAYDLVKESRKIKKLVKENETEKKLLERQLLDVALKRESPSKKQALIKSTSVIEEYSKELKKRINMASQSWQYISTVNENLQENRDIVQSVIENRFSKYGLDAAAMGIRVPNILLRESSKMFLKLEVDNVYNGGNLNLVSTLLLWNVCLKMIKEQFQREKLPNFSTVLPLLTTQVHKHHCHLKATKELRDDVTKKTLPNLKHSIDVLKKNSCLETSTASQSMPNLGLGLTTPTVKSKYSNTSAVVSLSESPIATSLHRSMTPSRNKVFSMSPLMDHSNPLQVLSLPKISTSRSMKESKVPIAEIKLKEKVKKQPTPAKHKVFEKSIQRPVKEHRPQRHFQSQDTANLSKHTFDDFLIDEVVQSVLNSTAISLDGHSQTVDFGSSFSPLMLGELKDQNSHGKTANMESFLLKTEDIIGQRSPSSSFSPLMLGELKDQNSQCKTANMESFLIKTEDIIRQRSPSKDVEQLDISANTQGQHSNITFPLNDSNSDIQNIKLSYQDKALFDSFQTSPLPNEMTQLQLSHTFNNKRTLKTSNESLHLSSFPTIEGQQSLHLSSSPTIEGQQFSENKDASSLQVELLHNRSYNSTLDGAGQDCEELLLSPTYNDKHLIDFLDFDTEENEQCEDVTKDSGSPRKRTEIDSGTSLLSIQEKLSALRQKASDILDISLDSSTDD